MNKKDFFSGHSKLYAMFRPTYPESLYSFIFNHVKNFDCAWDCATGNGQVAGRLSQDFKKVFANDISQQQLDNAIRKPNIYYSINGAEQTAFADHQFDLITVGQALHWFEIEKFYAEVKRVAKQDALLALWGYSLCNVNPKIDLILNNFYRNEVGPYWDDARKIVEEEYKNIPFPFNGITTPKFSIDVHWTLPEFSGYITTWSATQKFIKAKGFDPVPEMINKIKSYWINNMPVSFPLFLKLGEINS